MIRGRFAASGSLSSLSQSARHYRAGDRPSKRLASAKKRETAGIMQTEAKTIGEATTGIEPV
jgi:hypothetical protein